MTFRVEITRDETVSSGGATAEITAYIERTPEPIDSGYEELARVRAGVWNSRLLIAGDFAELADALAAISARFPEIDRIRCYEWAADCDYPVGGPVLVRAGGKWVPQKAG